MLPLLFVTLVTAVAARRSPGADYVENWLKQDGNNRYSSDVIEDALLDVPDLIEKYGYPLEIHKVITSDYYVLEAHRIPHGRDQNNESDTNRPVVLLMHGLSSSSVEFVAVGPASALAYILAEAGYDVWLGNARGNYYSRENLYLDPDDRRNLDFWRFSWDEIGNIDLPAFIDYILKVTGQSKLHYIGYSQGCTAFLVLASLRPEYNEKIISFQGIAPAAFFVYNENAFLDIVPPYEASLEDIASKLGIGEILGNRELFMWFAVNHCIEGSVLHRLCSILAIGGDTTFFNTTLSPIYFGHTPVGVSIRQVIHYGQCANSKEFRRYNHLPITNIAKYGRPVPPSYDLSQITTPVYLYYSLGDTVADYRDILYLADRLPNVVSLYQVERPSFTHLDYAWAIDAKEQVYDKLITFMKKAEATNKN
ncbi:lipase 1-like [Galleria mellonella]|uniref:Lipase n=1 Tax=Galleria mellonella TaxID=7137 RepID=A0ABM3N791_GALME|nr:lipase 1-like [Galleria mellonella]